MRMVIFLTYTNSLSTWAEAGILERELSLYLAHARSGVDVSIVSYGGKNERKFAEAYPEINVLCNHRGLSLIGYSLLLPLLFRKELSRANFYKTNQLFGAHVAHWCSLWFRKPVIVRQGFGFFEHLAKANARKKLKLTLGRIYEYLVLRLATKCIFTTQFIYDDCRSRVKDISRCSLIIPNFVLLSAWRYPYKHLPVRPLTRLVFFGRFEAQKNLLTLVEAIQGLPVHLLLIGDVPTRQLKEKIQLSRVQITTTNRVTQSELVPLVSKCDIFVLPSHYEGHPKSLIECMMLGITIVASDCTGIRNILRDGETGILARGDVDGIREGITRALALSVNQRVEMGKRSRDYVEEQFTMETVLELEKKCFKDLVGQNT